MPPPRINVSSGRPLEALAHYSRALRVGECVLQSGTTAIDREGNVIGEGDVARQVDAIFEIAAESMGAAGGRLEDVVCSRLYVTEPALVDAALRAASMHWVDARPAISVVPVRALARPAQLVEIELEAIDGAATGAKRVAAGHRAEEHYAASSVLRMGQRVWVSGAAAFGGVAEGGDAYAQTRGALAWIEARLDEAGAAIKDLVCTRSSIRDLAGVDAHRRAKLDALGDTRPASTLVGTPPFASPGHRLEIEAEAMIGAELRRRELFSDDGRERPLAFSRAVAVGERIYVSGAIAVGADGRVAEPGDWARQIDRSTEQIGAVLEEAGAVLEDVVQRRIFTVAGAPMNRAYGEGPGWFSKCRPTALGCRIDGLVHPDVVVEVDAIAVRGAHAGIEWRSLDE